MVDRLMHRLRHRPAALLLLALLTPAWLPVTAATASPSAKVADSDSPRIVALAPGLAELVYAAGAGDFLVGTVAYSDYPPAAAALPRIGDAFRIDYEALRRLQPSLVLSWESGTPRVVVERLRQLNFNVVEFEPDSLDRVATEIERLGALAGTESRAAAAAAGFRGGVADLQARYARRERLSVFYQISADPWFTVGGAHVISEVLSVCGGDNVFSAVPGVAPAISLEAILRADPQVVIAGTSAPDWKAAWTQWPFLRAVGNDTLYAVDPDLVTRGTPRLLQGMTQICAALDDAREGLAAAD